MKKQIREIRVGDLWLYFALPLAALLSLTSAVILFFVFLPLPYSLIPLAVMLLPFYYALKYFVIGSVLMYKAFAPLSVRERCRFEPTCSTYMIMAIRKYGLFVGVIKGIRRITRCREPNGGVDLP